MRKLYRVVVALKGVSGWTWSDSTGASITHAEASSWDDYQARHPEAKPFRNKGWPHFHTFATLMPSPNVGANVFHPSQPSAAPTPPPSSTPAPTPPSDTITDTQPFGNSSTIAEDAGNVSDVSDDEWEVSIYVSFCCYI